jgi:exodeoxyribonuclease VII small subunit
MTDAKSPTPPATESTTYKDMLLEVETICRDVSSPDVDLDEMVQKIEHGYGLIKTMRARLEETKAKVEQLRLTYE